ncbi:gas vesicle protein [Scopulibacillus daqui]|uniref:Gas vesicle protein n=1 Tax=Scopulibacillus daqui TaxID=1469162 RepID=A0ABS2Q0E8_9BACL|nr:YtxH domain-containing protein [Scopulibacillus daqui]MBM7645764.1 gas vesicle protein [Scopulibacillus daqui]
MSAKNFIVGSLVGGAVGAFTALMLAPKSGEEFRKDLCGTSSGLIDKSSDLAISLTQKTSDVIDKAKKAGQNLTNKEDEPYS